MAGRVRDRLLEIAAGVGILLAVLALRTSLLGPWTALAILLTAVLIAVGTLGILWELLKPILGRDQHLPNGGIHVLAEAGSNVTINQAEPGAALASANAPRTTDYEKAKFVHETLHICDLPLKDSFFLRDRVFERCELLGPAILLPIRGITLDHCAFGGSPTSLVWTLPDPRSVIGVIGVERCEFRQCTFTLVAFAAAQQDVRRWRDGISGKDWSTCHGRRLNGPRSERDMIEGASVSDCLYGSR